MHRYIAFKKRNLLSDDWLQCRQQKKAFHDLDLSTNYF